MTDPTRDLDAWTAAYRQVRRPPPELATRIRAAVEADARRRAAARWLVLPIAVAAGIIGLVLVRPGSFFVSGQEVDGGQAGRGAAAYESPPAEATSAWSRADRGTARGTEATMEPEASTAPVEATIVPPPREDSSGTSRPLRDPEEAAGTRASALQSPRDGVPTAPGPASTAGDGGPSAPLASAREVEDMRLLRRAEQLLESDPEEALRLVERHRRELPHSRLRLERDALHVLSLCAAGRVIEGRGWRARFLREHGGSAYAARVRASCPRD